MPRRLLIYSAWFGIALLASALRLHDLSDRPIHADEATGARILANRLADKTYQFDPQHFHGPLLSLVAIPIAKARHESSWAELTPFTLRLGPVIAGCLLTLTPLLWVRRLGTAAALAAASLLATSPLLVYYNRIYIHETLLTLLAMLGFAALYQLVTKPTRLIGILAGLSTGLMFATKETAAISLLSWCVALIAIILRKYSTTSSSHSLAPNSRDYLAPITLFTLTAALTASYFYSNGFTSPSGIIDALRTYFVYETTAGHEKPFTYYAQLMLWPKHNLGMWWSEATIALLAITAVATTFLKRSQTNPIPFITIATIAHLSIYSFIDYKTPWLMMVPWTHACLLAGCAFGSIQKRSPATRVTLVTFLLVGLAYQTQQSILASGRFENDPRNPYAYVPTSQDMQSLPAWLDALASTSSQTPATLSPIAVVGSEYWPLPWYLRNFETIGYWPTPIPEMQTFQIVFALPAQTDPTHALLQDTHTQLPRSLRANVPIMLYLRNDLWNQWIDDSPQ